MLLPLAPPLLVRNNEIYWRTGNEITDCNHVQESPRAQDQAARLHLQTLRYQDLQFEFSKSSSRSARSKHALKAPQQARSL
jgi:hypothetical protein